MGRRRWIQAMLRRGWDGTMQSAVAMEKARDGCDVCHRVIGVRAADGDASCACVGPCALLWVMTKIGARRALCQDWYYGLSAKLRGLGVVFDMELWIRLKPRCVPPDWATAQGPSPDHRLFARTKNPSLRISQLQGQMAPRQISK